MLGSKRVVCVIPARLKSTRFPNKMLESLKGKPLLEWVWRAASRVGCFDEVVFAIDSLQTAALIDSFHGKWWMTQESCSSGTDRLIELLETKKLDGDIWVNWQGDEPFICEEMIVDLLQSSESDGADVWTLKKKIEREEEYQSPQFAKVVCDAQGYALYFSRSPIPYYRDIADFSKKNLYKHVGLYAYSKQALHQLARYPVCPIELAEQLEQLRFLYNGLKLRVHETQYEVVGIDLPEHIHKAECYIEKNLITW